MTVQGGWPSSPSARAGKASQRKSGRSRLLQEVYHVSHTHIGDIESQGLLRSLTKPSTGNFYRVQPEGEEYSVPVGVFRCLLALVLTSAQFGTE